MRGSALVVRSKDAGTLGELVRILLLRTLAPMNPDPTPSGISQDAAPRSDAPHGHIVLVVEDDDALRTEIAEVLEQDGYTVIQATDGARALQILKQSPHVDVVLLDLWMPDMDGWTFRSEQRADPSLCDIPVIVLSADASAQARSIDADAFIRKPFDAEALSTTARRVIAEHRTESRQAAALVSETVSLLAGAISHEVADPLMALIAQLERMRGGDAGNAAKEPNPAVDDMLEQCWRIAAALRTLRDLPYPGWSREREVDVAQLVRAAVAWTGGEHLRFQCETANGVVVHGDPLVIVYVCTAVLRNAIEAIPKSELEVKGSEPHVEVRLSREDDEVVLDVRDRGPTIPEEDLRRLFSVDYAGRARAWSTGLRLWFVRQAVIGLGGSVQVMNAEPAGVRCVIRLPAATPASAQDSRVRNARAHLPAADRNM